VILAALGAALVQTARQLKPDTVASQRQLATDNAHTLLVALQRLAFDCGRPPTEREGLVALIHNPGMTNWQGPYIFELKPDPWGHTFRYGESPHELRVGSDGVDGQPDTTDDLWCVQPLGGRPGTGQGSYKVKLVP
jgi:hypothetical protein